MRVMRLVKGVTWRDRLRSGDIRAELQVRSILQFIEEAQLRWYGHVRTSRTGLRWLEWNPNTVRPRGRPRKRRMDNVKEVDCQRIYTGRRSNNQHCSWTEVNGKTSSLTCVPQAYQYCGTKTITK